jgi:predicted RNase H-like nuclease (RuvC/YqgF family)
LTLLSYCIHLSCYKKASYANEEAAQGSNHIDQANEQHIKDLEALVNEYKAHIRALETEIQELAKRPVLDHGSGLQALRDELSNEKNALQEARRGMSPNHLFPLSRL